MLLFDSRGIVTKLPSPIRRRGLIGLFSHSRMLIQPYELSSWIYVGCGASNLLVFVYIPTSVLCMVRCFAMITLLLGSLVLRIGRRISSNCENLIHWFRILGHELIITSWRLSSHPTSANASRIVVHGFEPSKRPRTSSNSLFRSSRKSKTHSFFNILLFRIVFWAMPTIVIKQIYLLPKLY